ncbi:hypothetical protein AB0C69_36800 [Actinomadura sp. NPDC048032]|uniref:hypothetical protein n=1 Tax=Actinomadura sp. NPDC048032 TaxID=3155747 RepID=UPI0033DC071E
MNVAGGGVTGLGHVMARGASGGDDVGMTRHGWAWTGAGVSVAAVAGLGAYFAAVGLDKADKLASVVGALTALIGLAMAAYGLFAPGGHQVSQRATASGQGRVNQVGGKQATTGDRGGGPGSGVPRRVTQDAEATEDGTISQVGGDQDPPGQP